jgi:hypothetical protein
VTGSGDGVRSCNHANAALQDLTPKQSLSDLRGEKESLSIEQLHEYADEAVSLKSELFILISQYTSRGIDELIT